jgi:phosphatidylinositol alpha 1,6-mannosyltransferase
MCHAVEAPVITPDFQNLRLALFSGNYNYTRDGANLSLNKLVEFLLARGAAVRIYSPVVDRPAFVATGDLVGVPAWPIPGRSDYRLPYRIGAHVKSDLGKFAPTLVHISAPEILGHWATSYALRNGLPIVASVHTRFDTYLDYYHLGFAQPLITTVLRRLYKRCNAIVAPSGSMASVLKAQEMNDNIDIWPSGVDRHVFKPSARSLAWRRVLGIGDQEVVIGFLGRLVMEKGLDVFCDAVDELKRRNIKHRVLVVGSGPAQDWFVNRLPHALFVGFQGGSDTARALASMDIFFNPSVTETFGIVTLEAMACGLPIVGADATGTSSLVIDGVSGRLIAPGAICAFADALETYVTYPEQRKAAGGAGIDNAKGYSWDAVNQRLTDTYFRLLSGPSSP